ncbi:MAG: hypothetical protein GX139_09375 [Armatimonadetes bacterium]|jgi:hypothetical protein|nr:hypothetical protein [Armatimonadota bacterium]
MSEDNRLDLSSDLEKVSKDFLKDVEQAAKEVKQRKAADREQDRRVVTRARERKISIAVISAAVILLLGIAYWLVFARQPQNAVPVNQPVTVANPKVNLPVARPPSRPVPARPSQDRGQRHQQNPYGDEPAGM